MKRQTIGGATHRCRRGSPGAGRLAARCVGVCGGHVESPGGGFFVFEAGEFVVFKAGGLQLVQEGVARCIEARQERTQGLQTREEGARANVGLTCSFWPDAFVGPRDTVPKCLWYLPAKPFYFHM